MNEYPYYRMYVEYVACKDERIRKALVYATREPPKMAQFDWFAISGYWAISRDRDLKLGILFSNGVTAVSSR